MPRTDMTISPYGRATCAGCGREMNLRKDGKIRHHLVPTTNRYASNVCRGAGKPPRNTTADAPAGAA